jgi:hypothetical protein
MPEDKLKDIYDFWDSEGYELGGYDNFQQKIADPEKRKTVFDFFSGEGYELGDSTHFDTTITNMLPKVVLPEVPPEVPPIIKDTTETKPTPPPEPIRQHPLDPGVYLAVANQEFSPRSERHKNYSAHTVPFDPELNAYMVENFGMQVGDSLPDNPNIATAKYDTPEQGKEASDFLINKLWEEEGGNVEEFVDRFIGATNEDGTPAIEDEGGAGRESNKFKNYVADIKSNLKDSQERDEITMDDLLFTEETAPAESTGIPLPVDPLAALPETIDFLGAKWNRPSIQDQAAMRNKWQENSQPVFGENDYPGMLAHGLPVPELDPDLKNIHQIMKDTDFVNRRINHQIAQKRMNDYWEIVANENNGNIPADLYEQYK